MMATVTKSRTPKGAGRYRKVYARLWRHPAFQRLAPDLKMLALYVLTGPQTNAIGIYYFSPAMAADELGITSESVIDGLRTLDDAFAWRYDADARVIYIPTWWRWNPPENANVLKGNLRLLGDVPLCSLTSTFQTNDEYLSPNLRVTFLEQMGETSARHSVEPFPIPNPKPPGKQEQEQEQDASACFGSLWDAYPKKRNRAEAEAAYDALSLTDLQRAALIEAVQVMVPSEAWQEEHGRYIPQLAAWLERGEWRDVEVSCPTCRGRHPAGGPCLRAPCRDCGRRHESDHRCAQRQDREIRDEIQAELEAFAAAEGITIDEAKDRKAAAFHDALAAHRQRIAGGRG